MEKCKVFNAFQIKILMAILMLFDHLRYISNFIPPEVASVFTIISRCVAPMFAYLVVEGIRHTRNMKKYCLRLSILVVIMFVGNAILNTFFQSFSRSLSDMERRHLLINNNVIFTLAMGVFAVVLIQRAKDTTKARDTTKLLYVIALICFMAGFIWGEWGTVLLPFMVIEYFFQNKKVIRYLGYCLIEIVAILLPFSEPLYFLVFPFILLYNGERGPKTRFSKYFFYIFYPIHIWVIYIINFIVTI